MTQEPANNERVVIRNLSMVTRNLPRLRSIPGFENHGVYSGKKSPMFDPLTQLVSPSLNLDYIHAEELANSTKKNVYGDFPLYSQDPSQKLNDILAPIYERKVRLRDGEVASYPEVN